MTEELGLNIDAIDDNVSKIWLDEDGWHRTYWSRAKARRDARRFIREEVARRRRERARA